MPDRICAMMGLEYILKKLLTIIGVLLAVNLALLWAGGRPVKPIPEGAHRIGLVFDVGGRGDKSFNDSAYAGLMRARDKLGVAVEYIEPGEGGDRESAIRIFASRGFSLIIGTGFIFTDDITLVAREYPKLRFAAIDYAVKKDASGKPLLPPPNVAALKFKEAEGSFLVGAAAALTTRTRKVGFIGGMDIPLIRRFEAGYRAGVEYICPKCIVLVNYAGVTSGSFKDPAKGKELALAQYRNGADIIFHASGSTGLGVFEAARQTKRLAIGVDSDQYAEAPGHILTSMVKRVDNTVYRIIEDVVKGRFAGGIRTFGLAELGVGYVYDQNNRNLLMPPVRKRVEELRKKIIAGEINVLKPRR